MVSWGKALSLIAIAFALILAPANLSAGERSTEWGTWDVDFGVSGGFLYQSFYWEDPNDVRMPEYVRRERYYSPMANFYLELRTNNLTDNPLLHGATYMHPAFDARSAGLALHGEVILEHRGVSYGTYPAKNVAALPKFFATVDTSFTVAGQIFRAGIEGGNLDDCVLYEGLAIYNIDVQGYRLHLKWKALDASVNHIGDLEYGIGLGIGDMHDYILSLDDLSLPRGVKLDARAGYSVYSPEAMNYSVALHGSDAVRLYSQFAVRSREKTSFEGVRRCASLVGARHRGAWKSIEYGLTAEYRFYGRYFNEGLHYWGQCFLYRERSNDGCAPADHIGNNLYPLHLFLRPFSQWAVYTDYQGRDVQTLIFRANIGCALPAHCRIFCDLDFNYLDVSNEESFLYPFCNVGFGWAPAAGTTMEMSYTNRAMNLDTFYPTLYLLDEGSMQIALRAAF